MTLLPPQLAAAILLATLACNTSQAPAAAGSIPSGWTWVATVPTPSARIAVVGDSLTWQAEHGSTSTSDPYYQRHALTDQLNAEGWAARIAARSGADTRSLSMWGGWQSAPDVIVMALGSNDRRYAPPTFPFQLGTSQWNVVPYLKHWPGACVVLVGIVETAPRGLNVYGPAWNRWLRYLADLKGWVFVDWATISAGHPDWFTSDLLHHTTAGQQAYRMALIEGVQRCR